MNNTFRVGQRVSGERYCGLPEGHRTTFVTGMCDMLSIAAIYAAPEHKGRFEAMIRYEEKFDSGALTLLFDKYMNEDSDRLKYQAASSFFSALDQWCGDT